MNISIPVSFRVPALLRSFCLLLFLAPANAQVQPILSAISKDTLILRMRELTGDLPVTIDGKQRTIYTRTSMTTGNRWAGQFLEDQFKRLGLSAQRQFFHSTRMRAPFYLNFTDLARNGRTFWMTSDWGEIFRSDDTARSWKTCRQSGTPRTDRLDWICVVDTSSLIVIGKTGIQAVTTDGGSTWQTQQTGFANLVHAVNNGRTVLAVCQDGLIWRSTNLGTTWTKQIIDTTTTSFAQAAFVSPTQAYIIGSDRGATIGRLYATTDGGSTWSPVSVPSSTPMQSVFALDPLHIWIACSGGNALSSKTGGSYWTSSRHGDSAYVVNRIYFCDTLNGWISTAGNKLYRTTNGGTTWALASTFSSTMQIQAFNFLTPSRGILIGGEYSGFSTMDGGTSWQDNSIPLLSNVVATLPGTKTSTKYVLVTAHYDLAGLELDDMFLEGRGADDDGSGTIGLLELARVFSQHPLPVPIKFAAVPDEESGMGGADVLGEELLAASDTVMAVLDLDMIGYNDVLPPKMTLIYTAEAATADLSNRYIKAVEENSIGLKIVRDPGQGGSNTGGFDGKAPVLMLIEGDMVNPTNFNPHYHTLTDSWNTLNGTYFVEMVRSAAALIYDLGVNGVSPYPGQAPTSLGQWQLTSGSGWMSGAVTSFATSGTTVFASKAYGVLLFQNTDASWAPVINGLTRKSVSALAIETAPGGTGVKRVYAGVNGSGVFVSTNSGTNWAPVNAGLTNKSVSALALSPGGAGTTYVYAGTNGSGVFLSTDNGSNWTAANAGIANDSVASLVVSPSSAGATVFAGTLGNGVYMSTNAGANWTPVNTSLTNMSVKALAAITVPGGSGTAVFAGTNGGLYLSMNNGASWLPVNLGESDTAVNSLATSSAFGAANVFASTASGVFMLRNNGTGWAATNLELTPDPLYCNFGAVGVSATHVFVATTPYVGVFWRSLASIYASYPIVPVTYRLEQNYPNPFNPSTTIRFSVEHPGVVKLRVFNVLGQLLTTLIDGQRNAGSYSVEWNALGAASGVYFYQLQAGDASTSSARGFVETKRMILLK